MSKVVAYSQRSGHGTVELSKRMWVSASVAIRIPLCKPTQLQAVLIEVFFEVLPKCADTCVKLSELEQLPTRKVIRCSGPRHCQNEHRMPCPSINSPWNRGANSRAAVLQQLCPTRHPLFWFNFRAMNFWPGKRLPFQSHGPQVAPHARQQHFVADAAKVYRPLKPETQKLSETQTILLQVPKRSQMVTQRWRPFPSCTTGIFHGAFLFSFCFQDQVRARGLRAAIWEKNPMGLVKRIRKEDRNSLDSTVTQAMIFCPFVQHLGGCLITLISRLCTIGSQTCRKNCGAWGYLKSHEKKKEQWW